MMPLPQAGDQSSLSTTSIPTETGFKFPKSELAKEQRSRSNSVGSVTSSVEFLPLSKMKPKYVGDHLGIDIDELLKREVHEAERLFHAKKGRFKGRSI